MEPRLLTRLVVTLGVGGFVAWMVALLVGLSSQSVTATVVLRTVLGVAIVVMLTRIAMRRAYDEPSLPVKLAVAGVLSYLLSPPAWAGRSLIAQLVLDPGPATFLVDLVVWVGAVLLAGVSADVRPAPAERRPYQLD